MIKGVISGALAMLILITVVMAVVAYKTVYQPISDSEKYGCLQMNDIGALEPCGDDWEYPGNNESFD